MFCEDVHLQTDKAGIIGQATKNQVHQTLKDKWCAGQSEWHHFISPSDEICLVPIGFSDRDVMIPRAKVQRLDPGTVVIRRRRHR